ncbi:hypothetical protein GCM10011588_44950 [Nocardia jinanensis]|uniref:Uncharacterized protein n=1 Tax=Nocardia jinanensis TaxID=382504 RepID=A0A917RTC9_9NOCA|nr:hypothetical protein GCM10011588_44950 [Nocardia jinanensis]
MIHEVGGVRRVGQRPAHRARESCPGYRPVVAAPDRRSQVATGSYRTGEMFTGVVAVSAPFAVEIDLGRI